MIRLPFRVFWSAWTGKRQPLTGLSFAGNQAPYCIQDPQKSPCTHCQHRIFVNFCIRWLFSGCPDPVIRLPFRVFWPVWAWKRQPLTGLSFASIQAPGHAKIAMYALSTANFCIRWLFSGCPPYSFVRHPSYTGAVLAYLGILCYYGAPGSWFMECLFKGTDVGRAFGILYVLVMTLVVAGLLSRVSKEDEGLKREFGEEWVKWAGKVPYALIPGMY